MKKTKLLYSLIICILSISATCLTGCSIIDKKPTADLQAKAAAETAYYTCDGCHGSNELRVEFMSPKIIGQKKAYLAAKLRDFRDMKRLNPYMNGVVAKFSNQDIDNLAAYYSNYGQSKSK